MTARHGRSNGKGIATSVSQSCGANSVYYRYACRERGDAGRYCLSISAIAIARDSPGSQGPGVDEESCLLATKGVAAEYAAGIWFVVDVQFSMIACGADGEFISIRLIPGGASTAGRFFHQATGDRKCRPSFSCAGTSPGFRNPGFCSELSASFGVLEAQSHHNRCDQHIRDEIPDRVRSAVDG